MELKFLKYFVEIAEQKSMRKAADKFNVSDLPSSAADSTLTLTTTIETGDDALADNVDSKVGETNSYTVKVTPKEGSTDIAGQQLTVKVKAQLGTMLSSAE